MAYIYKYILPCMTIAYYFRPSPTQKKLDDCAIHVMIVFDALRDLRRVKCTATCMDKVLGEIIDSIDFHYNRWLVWPGSACSWEHEQV